MKFAMALVGLFLFCNELKLLEGVEDEEN